MERYAIIKDGRNFIVQSEEQSVFKCTSRRRAAKLVADANGLMREDNASRSHPEIETSAKGKAQQTY
ncbi:hypothetical protein BH10PSE11_BH10PSE11_20630 [soil metagenome]